LNRKLKINKRFAPCPEEDGDELYPNGIFVFNITKLVEYIQRNGIVCEELLVEDFSGGSSKFNLISANLPLGVVLLPAASLF